MATIVEWRPSLNGGHKSRHYNDTVDQVRSVYCSGGSCGRHSTTLTVLA